MDPANDFDIEEEVDYELDDDFLNQGINSSMSTTCETILFGCSSLTICVPGRELSLASSLGSPRLIGSVQPFRGICRCKAALQRLCKCWGG